MENVCRHIAHSKTLESFDTINEARIRANYILCCSMFYGATHELSIYELTLANHDI